MTGLAGATSHDRSFFIPILKPIVLASASPRRRSLFRQVGIMCDIMESGVPEDVDVPAEPSEHVTVLSQRKAAAVAARKRDAFVVGADTIVVLDGVILGKPSSAADAVRMLTILSNRTHTVYTGVTIRDCPSGKSVTAVEMTDVTFRELGKDEIESYVRSGSPMDKAGAYGIQDDYGAVFATRINGCFYNVVGFPLARFFLELQKFQQTIDRL
jgi:septum formation protein